MQAKDERLSATSALLEGEWRFLLVGEPAPGLLSSPTRAAALLLYAGGYSPGVLGLSVLQQLPSSLLSLRSIGATIRPTQPRLEVSSELGVAGGSSGVQVQVFSRLEVVSGRRLVETWSEVLVNGSSIALPAQLAYSRSLFLTFLDDTLCVMRDESGAPTVLRRAPAPAPPPPPPPPPAAEFGSEAAPIVVMVVDEESDNQV